MRIEAVQHDVQTSGVMEVSKAKIRASRKIFDMFESGTYSNVPVAIFRELVANGVDAHKAAGRADRPVEVTLPTELDPTCRVRDFGTGMEHSFVMGPFMEYTNGSTKDQDDEAIGGFGIGSKSPFAYVDTYTLRVVHEGVLSVYVMFKDEEGLPAIGLQAQTTTDEPNGVEVSFPVEDADMQKFREAAQEALQYFQPLPLVKNGTLNGPDYTFVGNGWAMRPSAGALGVIMGGVRYPVEPNSLDYATIRADTSLYPLVNYGLDITLPLGACRMATSREALKYDPKTNNSIKEGLQAILDDVVATFANYFDKCSTKWEAMDRLMTEVGTSSYNRSPRAQLLMSNAKYMGEKLETGFHLTDDMVKGGRVWAILPTSARRGTTCPPPKWQELSAVYTISPGQTELVIIDDLPQSPKSKTIARIQAYVNDNQAMAKTIYVFRGEKEAKDVKTFMNILRGPTNVVLTSAMPVPSAAPKAAKSARPRIRMFTFNGHVDRYTYRKIMNLTPAASKSGIVTEIKYVDQPSSGIMVAMNSFDLPAGFHERMATGLVSFSELHFVNAVDAPKIKSTFRDFEEVFQTRLKAELADYPDLAERVAVADISEFAKLYELYVQMKNAGIAAPSRGAFSKIAALHDKYVAPLTPNQRKLAPFVKVQLPKGVKPEEIMKGIDPAVEILQVHLRLNHPEHLKIIAKFL